MPAISNLQAARPDLGEKQVYIAGSGARAPEADSRSGLG